MKVEPSSRPQWLVFRLGGRTFAVAMEEVVRVAEIETLSSLPGDLECNLGLAVHEGVVVGILDLEVLLDLRHTRHLPAAPFTCIFGRFARGVAGFPVDALLGLERSSGEHTVVELRQLEASR